MIKGNTILGLDLFSSEILESYIFHIPHSKVEIPEQYMSDFVSAELVNSEIKLLTDFATDEMFTIEGTSKVVFPYSRIFCDVERLDDENEVMYKYGRGFYYTKTDSGDLIRNDILGNKSKIYNDYYLKHHEELTNLVDKKINDVGFALIIDCHSFADTPFTSDLVQDVERPDFCLGTDDFHTPKWLIDLAYLYLTSQGYSVGINSPYVGTIVPMKHYKKNDSVQSIMFEVNRKLYMDDGVVNDNKVKDLNLLLTNFFLDNY